MYCKRFLIKYFLHHASVLFVYNNVFQFFKFFNSGTTNRKAILINNGLEEGRTHQDSNLDYRIQSPMCLPLHHKSFTSYKVNV